LYISWWGQTLSSTRLSKGQSYNAYDFHRKVTHRVNYLKVARGKTAFCISHGGGTRCAHSGCVKQRVRMFGDFCRIHALKESDTDINHLGLKENDIKSSSIKATSSASEETNETSFDDDSDMKSHKKQKT
jgi:hypothetical protein